MSVAGSGEGGAVSSYRRILKSTFLMAGSSVFGTLLGVLRTKIIALLLGPSGVGLTGVYMTIMSLVGTVSGLGIRECGVRELAGALQAGDRGAITRTVLMIKRVSLLAGVAGLAILFLASSGVSRLSFGHAGRSLDVKILSLGILLATVFGGQTALIQGSGRIKELAKVGMIAALAGTIFTIPVIYLFGEKGIASYLVIVAAASVVAAWWYGRSIQQETPSSPWRDSFSGIKPLLKLGAAFMIGALLGYLTQYLLRVFVIRHYDLSAAGVYQAAATLSIVYANLILNAMITDFYPRLSAVAHDGSLCRSLINNQIEVGLLLAVPGILAIMTFAPVIIAIFYSQKFLLSAEILRWQLLGVLLQVVAWPMGVMLRAKGDGKLFLWSELFSNASLLSLAWVGMRWHGLTGLGMAFFGANLLYWGLIWWMVGANYQFRLSLANARLLGGVALLSAAVFATPYLLPRTVGMTLSSLVIAGVGVYAVKRIDAITGGGLLPGFLLKLKSYCRL